MKKILSITIAFAMLLSLAAGLTITSSAIDGAWHVIPGGKALQLGYDGDEPSLSGYEYTDDGFHTIPTSAWEKSNPHLSIQTKSKYDLKEGIYLEIRIDDFTYEGDKWFDLHIWDSVGVEPGSSEKIYGQGVGTLIRPTDSTEGPGKVTRVDTWYCESFKPIGSSDFNPEENLTTEDGKPILAMNLSWDGTSYALSINGASAPQEIIDFMNQKWGGADSEAYIGFNAMNTNMGGTAEVTVLKFGSSAATATTPMGDDIADPTDNTVENAPISDPGLVEAGAPAIMLTADKENSDMKGILSAANGGVSTINEDFSIHVIAEKSTFTAGNYTVKNEVSYDINDFPVAITLTKNFCTCGYEDGSCDAVETALYYICAGDILSATPGWFVKPLDICYNSYNIGEDTYLYFFCDFSKIFEFEEDSRINGLRFDVYGMDPSAIGANSFDLMFTAFFKTVEDAEAYVEQYLTNLGWVEPAESETKEIEETTEFVEQTDETNIESAQGGKDPEQSEQPTGDAETETESTASSGCKSAIGCGLAAILSVAVCGIVSFKKKEE